MFVARLSNKERKTERKSKKIKNKNICQVPAAQGALMKLIRLAMITAIKIKNKTKERCRCCQQNSHSEVDCQLGAAGKQIELFFFSLLMVTNGRCIDQNSPRVNHFAAIQ